jgi:hypothetical protein
MRLWAAFAVALLQLPMLSTQRLASGARPCPVFALPPLGATSGQLRHQIAVFSGVFKACRGRARGPALQGAAPRWDAGDAGEKDTAALLARMQRLEERLAAGEERARARISELEERLTVVEKRARVCIRVAQYNVLASYLGNNREPWFLYGALECGRTKLLPILHSVAVSASVLQRSAGGISRQDMTVQLPLHAAVHALEHADKPSFTRRMHLGK